MIIVAGTITLDAANQEMIVTAAQKVAAATRMEDGCISYEFFADLAEPGRLHIFEES